MPYFSENMYSEFNEYIYKTIRDPTSSEARDESKWTNEIGGTYKDYI